MNSDKKDFKVGDVWLTRNGKQATILLTNLKNTMYPVAAICPKSDTSDEVVELYTANGMFLGDGRTTHARDLVRKYEEPVGPEEIKVSVHTTTGRVGAAWPIGNRVNVVEGWKLVKYRRVDEAG